MTGECSNRSLAEKGEGLGPEGSQPWASSVPLPGEELKVGLCNNCVYLTRLLNPFNNYIVSTLYLFRYLFLKGWVLVDFKDLVY